MNYIAPAGRIITQGRALLSAIEALGTIEPSGPFERALAWLLLVRICAELLGSWQVYRDGCLAL